MLERLAARVNADANLVRRGRFVDTTFLVEIGTTGYVVRIAGGQVASVERGPFVMPRWSFALRAPAAAWEKFWQALPPPGYNDLLAMVKRRELRIEGDQHPLMANLMYFKDVLASLRAADRP